MELPDPPLSHRLARPEPNQDDIDEYRRLSSEQASGVAVVSTVWRGRDYAATVSSYLSVSYDPPTMLVSLYEGSRITEAVAASGRWALSLLNGSQQRTANWLASPGAPVEGMLAQTPFRRGEATGSAIIDGSLSYFEVETTQVHEAATHLLVVGTVVAMGTPETGPAGLSPLIHYAGDYHRLRG
jgi:flavin reductase (DIM6/NTAB) family NADH-FMN oxidoreductase RutF